MSAGRALLLAREEALLGLGVGHHDEEVDDGRDQQERDDGVQERAEGLPAVAEDVRRPTSGIRLVSHATKAVTTAAKASAMMRPTAISTRLP